MEPTTARIHESRRLLRGAQEAPPHGPAEAILRSGRIRGGALFLLSLLVASTAWAEGVENTPMSQVGGAFPVDLLWTVIAAMLVFFMQAGFALVEAGFTRAKNVVNIMMKNIMDFACGSLAFWAVGFGVMFGDSNGILGTSHFFIGHAGAEPATYAFVLFQSVFCGTAATIVSGAMSERTRFSAYLVYSVVLSALIYPIFGSWAWGSLFAGRGLLEAPEGGLLAQLGLPPFIDFAGSTVVHSVGGWAALAGAMVIGPRIGKFNDRGQAQPIFGHNMALSSLGVFVLWLGWFGFNAGSTTSVVGGGADSFSGTGKAIAMIAFNTNLAACAGAVSAMLFSRLVAGKPDIGLTLNGALAGLVSITAGCASVSPLSAVIIGMVGGGLVVQGVRLFDALKVDDPVGAISVHGLCGAWGTVAVALFHHEGFSLALLGTQLLGVGLAFVWAFGAAYVLFRLIDATIGLRVTEQEELEGLDLSEHAAEAYPEDWLSSPDVLTSYDTTGLTGTGRLPQS